MKKNKLTVVATAVAISLMACSEEVDSVLNVENGEPATGIEGNSSAESTYNCPDGSVVANATLCSSANAGANGDANSEITKPTGTPSSDDDGDLDLEDAKTLDGTEILMKLAGTTATVDNNNGCVAVEKTRAIVTCPGDYYVTGSSTDFQIVVNTPGTDDEGKTGIYLYNASIKSSSAPILVKNAKKTVLHLVKGTVNSVEDGATPHLFEKVSGTVDTAKAAIYAKDDLNIKGAGKLTVVGNYKNGIQCSNDLRIKNGDISVTAAENGVKGKGSLVISGGTLNIAATAGDGLESDECVVDALDSCSAVVDGKGIVMISGGTVNITAGDDGIQAYNYVFISDSSDVSSVKVKSVGKGIKSKNFIYVNGGTVEVDATDDAVHSSVNVYMNGGNVTLSTKDDGIHADTSLYLSGSTVNVVPSYEGMEAYMIRAMGGITATYATDDGWNAAGGAKETFENASSTAMLSTSSGHIVVSGGYHYVSGAGAMIDILDANGTIKQTGGRADP